MSVSCLQYRYDLNFNDDFVFIYVFLYIGIIFTKQSHTEFHHAIFRYIIKYFNNRLQQHQAIPTLNSLSSAIKNHYHHQQQNTMYSPSQQSIQHPYNHFQTTTTTTSTTEHPSSSTMLSSQIKMVPLISHIDHDNPFQVIQERKFALFFLFYNCLICQSIKSKIY